MPTQISPWHYTTGLDMLDHWQRLLAGLLGFGAVIMAVRFTLGAERRKQDRELVALRRSFGVEFRQCLLAALGAHQSMKKLAQSQTPITVRVIENLVILQKPVIYPASANKIGLLGAQAMDIVATYGLLQAVRDSIARLQRHRTPDNIASILVASTAGALVRVCIEGAAVLPNLKTEVPHIDERDDALIQLISNEAATWEIARLQWPELA
jgi:hypothetical protein